MEDQNPTTTTATGQPVPTGGQVMDIATPGQQGQQIIEPTPASTPAFSDTQQPATPAPITTPISFSEPVAAAPSPSEPVVTEAAQTGLTASSSSEPMHEPPATNPAEIKHEAPNKHQAPHSGAPVAAIVIAIVVALALAGVVIFSYLKTRDNGAINRSDSTNTVTEKPQASVTDVDTASEEIDSSLANTDDDKDFANTELSDTSLGL